MVNIFGRTVFAAAITVFATSALAQLKVSVSGEPREEVSMLTFVTRYGELGNYIGAAAGLKARMYFASDLSRELQRTRSHAYDVMFGPAHVIGTAIRYGYEPVARFTADVQAVFVASGASGVTTFDQAAGKRLALPPPDSLATYLARGELNAMGVQVKTYFADIREFRYHQAALFALQLGQADVAVADRPLAEEWLKTHKGRVLLETKRAPGNGIAVLSALDPKAKKRIKSAFLRPDSKLTLGLRGEGLDITKMKAISREDYAYVSTLGYFTPRTLAGAKIVTAEEADVLMKKGIPLYDTRVKDEYDDNHIKGAVSLPYGEKSHKEVGFDGKRDSFDLSKLPQDRNAAIVFACNGPECWKSYKASVTAINAGYKQIYWFRGGFPEWSLKGYPVEAVPSLAMSKQGSPSPGAVRGER